MADERKRGKWRILAACLLVLLLLYALSIGPAWWLSERSDPNHDGNIARFLTAFYQPLELAAASVGADGLLWKYVDLFVDFHEQEIVAILKSLNDWNPEIVQRLNNQVFTGDLDDWIVDTGEVGGWVGMHERKANVIGYTLYWSRAESRYLARPLRTVPPKPER